MFVRASVRNDNGVCWREFDVEQGVHQGCVRSRPLLFSIFFAAVLIILQRFSKDPDIFVDLVHL